MQLCHHDLGRGPFQFVVFLDPGRNSAPVVQHRDRIVGVDRDNDFIAVGRKRLIHGVVYNLEDHVVQACSIGRVADVHAGAFSHRLEPFQDLDAVGAVGVGVRLLLFRITHVHRPSLLIFMACLQSLRFSWA